jgi:glycosyltransferase involved in cell wall biosynthesis
LSKAHQYLGLKRHFEFFSEKRLELIAKEFYQHVVPTRDFVFFHGTTPWIKCQSDKPYFAYVDATFLTYLDIYLNANNYKEKEIQRIVNQEKHFLDNATGIFFSSEWAKQETINRYGIEGSNFYSVGLGGNAEPQKELIYAPTTPSLLFVSMDFKRKGGHIAYECYAQLKKHFPLLTLQIIGDAPEQSIIDTEGIIYHGFIDKRSEEGMQRFDKIFRSASFLIHPTEKDMTPLIIVEAGYYGIPAIAPNRFGIPEMIQHNHTGYVVENNSIAEYTHYLADILKNTNKQELLRQNCFKYISANFTWQKVGKSIVKVINQSVKQ